MYLNLPMIFARGLNLNDVGVLQIIKQNRIEDNSQILEKVTDELQISFFEQYGLVSFIKGTKKDSYYQKIRLTSKGNTLLEDIQTPEVEEGDLHMAEYLCEMYLKSEDAERRIGNKKQVKRYCSIFRKYVGLSLHEMYWLCDLAVSEITFSKRLDYLFWNPRENMYGKFENHVEDSKLYQFYDNNKDKVERYWRQKIKENEETN